MEFKVGDTIALNRYGQYDSFPAPGDDDIPPGTIGVIRDINEKYIGNPDMQDCLIVADFGEYGNYWLLDPREVDRV